MCETGAAVARQISRSRLKEHIVWRIVVGADIVARGASASPRSGLGPDPTF
jgi:hypothetical protein